VSLSPPANSTVVHSLQRGITIEYDLPPHVPQEFINYMFWSIEARCKITSEADSVDLFAKALVKQGKINDITLATGQSMQLNIHSGENIKLRADPGAKVEITNMTDFMAHATCTT
jgi:hypothetical protein